MLEQVNKFNVAKLCLVPITYLLLKDYQVLQGFVLGLLSLSLFGDIHQYGLKALILKPDQGITRQVFDLI